MSSGNGGIVGATKIVDHGSDLARYVIAVLSEGYQQSEIATFATDALNFANALATRPPYPSIWAGVNVWRVDVSSTQSGASDTGNCGMPAATKQTYFNALFCPSGSGAGNHRLLTVDSTLARSVADAYVTGTNLVVVLVNSSIYGGSGDSSAHPGVAVLSRDPQSIEIGIHEMGHAAFGLADEYTTASPTDGGASYSGAEPVEPNVTTVTDANSIKWKALLTPGIAMPTSKNQNCAVSDPSPSPAPAGSVGAFEGARYFNCGIFRPEYDCQMRTLGKPFCHVCSDEILNTLQPYASAPNDPPQISGISPSTGVAAGGTIVVISGTGLLGAGSVNFGANSAVTWNVDSDSQITAVSPAGNGAVSVWVATDVGSTSSVKGATFSYSTPVSPPTVAGVAPTTGPTTGGTTVTISGSGLTGAVAVAFGAQQATGVTVVSDTQITALSPASLAGTVDISVTGPGGASAASTADQFTYSTPAPSVASVSPANGPESGGTVVTVAGNNFTGASAVSFGAAGAAFTLVSDSTITATSPIGSGAVDVIVTTASGTSPTGAADQFTYVASAPAISGVAPATGDPAGGASVTVTGAGFTGATAVAFGATAAASFTVASDTSINAVAPAGQGQVDISVRTPAGTSAAVAADQFTYAATASGPVVTSVSPNSGAVGDSVTIAGTGFTGASAVAFGAAAATNFSVVDDASITATVPGGSGTVDVAVTTASGISATSSDDQFTYAVAASVSVTGVSPVSGSSAGGDNVIVTGLGFTGATSVMFGGDGAFFNVDSDTQITATSPAAAAAGTVDVTVTTPSGTSAAGAADQFTFF